MGCLGEEGGNGGGGGTYFSWTALRLSRHVSWRLVLHLESLHIVTFPMKLYGCSTGMVYGLLWLINGGVLLVTAYMGIDFIICKAL